jgi:hypothetical protein
MIKVIFAMIEFILVMIAPLPVSYIWIYIGIIGFRPG